MAKLGAMAGATQAGVTAAGAGGAAAQAAGANAFAAAPHMFPALPIAEAGKVPPQTIGGRFADFGKGFGEFMAEYGQKKLDSLSSGEGQGGGDTTVFPGGMSYAAPATGGGGGVPNPYLNMPRPEARAPGPPGGSQGGGPPSYMLDPEVIEYLSRQRRGGR